LKLNRIKFVIFWYSFVNYCPPSCGVSGPKVKNILLFTLRRPSDFIQSHSSDSKTRTPPEGSRLYGRGVTGSCIYRYTIWRLTLNPSLTSLIFNALSRIVTAPSVYLFSRILPHFTKLCNHMTKLCRIEAIFVPLRE